MLFAPLAAAALAALAATVSASSHHGKPARGHYQRAALREERTIEASANATLVKRSYTGTGTYYYVGLGACGTTSVDSDYLVALNTAQYGSGYPGPQCFKTVTIEANGVTVSGVPILDECPTCDYGSLDLSPSLFQRYADESVGTLSITWWFDSGSSDTATTTSSSQWVAPTTSSSKWVAPTTSSSQWVAPTTSSSLWTPDSSTDTPTSTSTTVATTTSAPATTTTAAANTTIADLTATLSLNATATLNATLNATASVANIVIANATVTVAQAAVTQAVADGVDEDTSRLYGLAELVVNLGGLITDAAESA